ncbi:MAG: alpha-glucosidase C-terminal domain-containing protein, partial [Panacibacter sp.]
LKAMKNIFMLAESNKASQQEDGFDATYPWDEFSMMKLIAKGDRPAFAFDSVVSRVDSTFPGTSLLLYFTSNHDENSWSKADYGTMPGASHAPFAVLTQTMKRSVPMIYSGQEEPFLDSISFFYKDTIAFGKYGRADFYKTLLDLRKENPALSANAPFTTLKSSNDNAVYAFERISGNRRVLVILNLTGNEQKISLPGAVIEGVPENVFLGKPEQVTNEQLFELKPWDYIVYSY